MQMETGVDKLKRKLNENPLVPVGCLATAAVLIGGLRSFSKGSDSRTQQRFMRARVVVQGATVIALGIGSVYANRDIIFKDRSI